MVVQKFNLLRCSMRIGSERVNDDPIRSSTVQRDCSHHLTNEFVNTTNGLFLLSCHFFLTSMRTAAILAFPESI